LTGPEPVPRPISDPAVVLLVKTTQRLLLKQYDNLATIACFMQGNSVSSCRPPWISGFNWSNETLGQSIMANTATNPSWECSSDKLYLSNNERVFYGFTSENVTDGLQGIAHSASLFASLACTYNSTCAAAYSNDTAQMYYDFRNHINVTFFDYMHRKLPSNNSKSYCPNFVGSQASALTLVTTSFNGGKEYFGIHDVVFMPGVAQTINGTLEEAKKEFRLLLGTTLRKAEGVFLNMILFTWGSKLGLERRADASFEEEVYPGCPRREWILNGGCEGVIPPREFDLAGSVVPMPERDRCRSPPSNPLSFPPPDQNESLLSFEKQKGGGGVFLLS
jgi:hypothetical protein